MSQSEHLVIRPALQSDCADILNFIKALAEYEKLLHEVVATTAKLEETLFGDQSMAEVLIAEWDGQAAGFALFFHNYSTFLAQPGIYLEDLFVHPQYRGKSIGKKLLGSLARLAVKRGCGRLDWSVLDWNEPAIRFYKSIGAEAMDGWTQNRLSGKTLESVANSLG